MNNWKNIYIYIYIEYVYIYIYQKVGAPCTYLLFSWSNWRACLRTWCDPRTRVPQWRFDKFDKNLGWIDSTVSTKHYTWSLYSIPVVAIREDRLVILVNLPSLASISYIYIQCKCTGQTPKWSQSIAELQVWMSSKNSEPKYSVRSHPHTFWRKRTCRSWIFSFLQLPRSNKHHTIPPTKSDCLIKPTQPTTSGPQFPYFKVACWRQSTCQGNTSGRAVVSCCMDRM